MAGFKCYCLSDGTLKSQDPPSSLLQAEFEPFSYGNTSISDLPFNVVLMAISIACTLMDGLNDIILVCIRH